MNTLNGTDQAWNYSHTLC